MTADLREAARLVRALSRRVGARELRAILCGRARTAARHCPALLEAVAADAARTGLPEETLLTLNLTTDLPGLPDGCTNILAVGTATREGGSALALLWASAGSPCAGPYFPLTPHVARLPGAFGDGALFTLAERVEAGLPPEARADALARLQVRLGKAGGVAAARTVLEAGRGHALRAAREAPTHTPPPGAPPVVSFRLDRLFLRAVASARLRMQGGAGAAAAHTPSARPGKKREENRTLLTCKVPTDMKTTQSR